MVQTKDYHGGSAVVLLSKEFVLTGDPLLWKALLRYLQLPEHTDARLSFLRHVLTDLLAAATTSGASENGFLTERALMLMIMLRAEPKSDLKNLIEKAAAASSVVSLPTW